MSSSRRRSIPKSTLTAKNINLILKKNEAKGPSWETAFRLTTAKRENDKGKFYVARVATVAATAKHVEAAADLAQLVAGAPEPAPTRSDEPAI